MSDGQEGVSEEIRAYLNGVVGIVEANSFEKMCLWKEWNDLGRSWVSTGHGYLATVGHFGGMPVCISILTETVEGQKILFWDATSRVIDHQMIDEWLSANVVSALLEDGYINKTDSMNFHNVFQRRTPSPQTKLRGSDNADA